MLSFDEALAQLLALAKPVTETRTLPLFASCDRVLAENQCSTLTIPPADNAAMDGYAICHADLTKNPLGVFNVSQRIPAGMSPPPLESGTAVRIFTGAPLPEGADTVIMQEDAQIEDGKVRFLTQPVQGDHVRFAGEDMAAGQEILIAGHALRPQEIALAAAAGIHQLPVYRRLRVGVFFTGNELTEPGNPLPPGGIYNSNRFAINALLNKLHCEVRDLGAVPDEIAATRAALREAAKDNDLVITSGGMSVGEEDYVRAAVEKEGEVALWKIAIKPGKPLAFGKLFGQKTPAWFLGLPGNPVASVVTFLMLVRPFILQLQGHRRVLPRSVFLPAAFDWKNPNSRLEFLRCKINDAGTLDAFQNQGSAITTSLVWADGLVANPGSRVITAGDMLQFFSFNELLV